MFSLENSNHNNYFSFLLKYLSLIVIAVGFVFVTIFHFGTKEEKYRDSSKVSSNKKNEASNIDLESVASNSTHSDSASDISGEKIGNEMKLKTWRDWLKDSRFYKTGVLYMCTRLSINVFQSFLALYLTDGLHFQKVGIFVVLVCIA